jgi:hypothetical protein
MIQEIWQAVPNPGLHFEQTHFVCFLDKLLVGYSDRHNLSLVSNIIKVMLTKLLQDTICLNNTTAIVEMDILSKYSAPNLLYDMMEARTSLKP